MESFPTLLFTIGQLRRLMLPARISSSTRVSEQAPMPQRTITNDSTISAAVPNRFANIHLSPQRTFLNFGSPHYVMSPVQEPNFPCGIARHLGYISCYKHSKLYIICQYFGYFVKRKSVNVFKNKDILESNKKRISARGIIHFLLDICYSFANI